MSVKTNAVRLLDLKKVDYILTEYDAPDGVSGMGVSVAKATGTEPERLFKTLVTQGASGEYYVCVIPAPQELDLKKAAKHFGEKKLEMIHARDITKVTGYIKGGCSPVGMKNYSGPPSMKAPAILSASLSAPARWASRWICRCRA